MRNIDETLLKIISLSDEANKEINEYSKYIREKNENLSIRYLPFSSAKSSSGINDFWSIDMIDLAKEATKLKDTLANNNVPEDEVKEKIANLMLNIEEVKEKLYCPEVDNEDNNSSSYYKAALSNINTFFEQIISTDIKSRMMYALKSPIADKADNRDYRVLTNLLTDGSVTDQQKINALSFIPEQVNWEKYFKIDNDNNLVIKRGMKKQALSGPLDLIDNVKGKDNTIYEQLVKKTDSGVWDETQITIKEKGYQLSLAVLKLFGQDDTTIYKDFKHNQELILYLKTANEDYDGWPSITIDLIILAAEIIAGNKIAATLRIPTMVSKVSKLLGKNLKTAEKLVSSLLQALTAGAASGGLAYGLAQGKTHQTQDQHLHEALQTAFISAGVTFATGPLVTQFIKLKNLALVASSAIGLTTATMPKPSFIEALISTYGEKNFKNMVANIQNIPNLADMMGISPEDVANKEFLEKDFIKYSKIPPLEDANQIINNHNKKSQAGMTKTPQKISVTRAVSLNTNTDEIQVVKNSSFSRMIT